MLTFRTIEGIEFQAEGELAQELDGERSSWGGGGRGGMARVPDHGGCWDVITAVREGGWLALFGHLAGPATGPVCRGLLGLLASALKAADSA